MKEITLLIKEFELSGREDSEVVFSGEPKLVDNGIGVYEFWGARGIDRQMEAECDDVEWNMKLYTDEENAIIEKYIDMAADKLCELWESPEPDYEPEDYIEKRDWREEAMEQKKLK
jgi:hypothetical protein